MTKSADPDDTLVLSQKGRIQLGGIIVADSLVAACPGTAVGGKLFAVALYGGPAQEFSW